ncbi:MAG TPA: NAD(P)-binding domain-containing protein [Vicinamibacterales bacterium]|nr:NAD(P)-binding domain-containing protein [Vicinamibacterales bacterium]
MKIGVLGTGMVGRAIGSKLVALGHDVMMGSRTADNVQATTWVKTAGARSAAGTFADAAAFGELVFNCTQGASSLAALRGAGAANLDGKTVVDVANVLSPERAGSESLGEQLQNALPGAKVVKTLNTVNCELMVDPGKLADSHTLFISGNDAGAKAKVRELLDAFGWTDIVDLGDIATARATEGYLPLWSSLWRQLGTLAFNIKVVR